MAGGGSAASRALIGPLAALNFCMYMIVLGIAGWALNLLIGAGLGISGLLGNVFPSNVGGNAATLPLLVFSLIAGVVGIASTLAGLAHMAMGTQETLSAATATTYTSWLLTLLAFGLACKEIHSSRRSSRLIALESFLIILSATHLLYLIVLHLAHGWRSSARDTGYGDPHVKAPAASAV